MYFRAREREILELLLHENRFITTQDIAKHLQVSARTILRELKNMDTILNKYALNIERKTSKGIRITGEKQKKRALLKDLKSTGFNDLSQNERKLRILHSLIHTDEPLKLFTLAEQLNVTTATISNDLDQMENLLASFDLTLVRKRGYGVELIGSEYGKRSILGSLILENLDEVKFFETMENPDDCSELFDILDENKIKTVERVLKKIQPTLLRSIADSAYVHLVIQLVIAIARSEKGNIIDIPQSTFNELKETTEYHSAVMIIQELEKAIQRKIPSLEVGYVTMILLGARRKIDHDFPLFDVDMDISRRIRTLINLVSEKTGYPFTEDHSLYQGLLAHVIPALNRRKKPLNTNNPLLNQIKTTFPSLFKIVQDGVMDIFSEQNFSDEDIGYLVLHFGSTLEKIKNAVPLKALIVCSSGIGLSKMLASRLNKEFPEIKNIQLSSLIDLINVDIRQYDLIISTIHLPYDYIPYITVNPLLEPNDILKIKGYINERLPTIMKNRKISINADKTKMEDQYDLNSQMNKITESSETIKKILENFQILQLNGEKSHEQRILQVCHYLKEEKIINNEQIVAEKLLSREKKGGLGIPDAKIALFHLRDPNILTPMFRIFELEKADTVLGMDGKKMEINRILFLLAPEHLSQQGLTILSLISSSIIENAESLRLFEKGDEKSIYRKLNAVFLHYMKETFY